MTTSEDTQEEETNSETVQPIPEDYGSITPYIIVKGVAPFLDFLEEAFGAEERGRVHTDDGTIGHAEVWIGDSVVMMFDAKEDWPETPSFLTLHVEDCDAVHQRAVEAGATEVTELSTNAWGDRGSRIRDPFGNIWWIQTHVEDVDDEELAKRMGEQRYIDDMQTRLRHSTVCSEAEYELKARRIPNVDGQRRLRASSRGDRAHGRREVVTLT